MSKHRFIVVIYLLMGLWVLISFTRLTYNYFKYFNGELYLYGKTDDSKRKLYFGDLHDFSKLIISKTKQGSKIMFYEADPRSFFLISYYIYPSLIFRGSSLLEAKNQLKTQKIDYILYYGAEKKFMQHFPNYQVFARFRGVESTKIGLLLRKR